MTDILTIPEAAVLLGVSERTIWRRIRSGELPTERIGRRIYVRRPADAFARRVAEAAPRYGTAPAEDDSPDALDGPWPYTRENLESQRRAILARRQAAVAETDRLAAETRPDPDGLTAVDYLRDIRDPDWDAEDGAP
ncbi:MAG: hypothetical protein A2X23_09560 [Chloroflexi bacterium GWC2_73_18]|nr:MAG: hypothetical protein A2X23_09560 [Chloroflexi bacterium GWC2_73_18]